MQKLPFDSIFLKLVIVEHKLKTIHLRWFLLFYFAIFDGKKAF